MVFAQITDLHIRTKGKLAMGVVDTETCLRQSLKAISEFSPRPDFILITGDLVDCGMVEEYQNLKEILAETDIPIRLVLGNHDRRETFLEVFGGEDYLAGCDQFIQYEIDAGPCRVICVDTVNPGESGGFLCADRLKWIDQSLSADREKPTVVALHHPPFKSGLQYMDDMGLENADDLEAIVAKAPNVERVLCGHLHRPVQAKWAGTVASVMSNPAHQLSVDLFKPDTPRLYMEPSEFQVHVWIEGQGLVSHTITVGDYGPPMSPNLEDEDYKRWGWG